MSVSYSMGLDFGLKGMAASVLGGMGNTLGAIVGGLVLGLVEVFAAAFISSGYKDAIALALLVLLLIFRPQGLLGGRVVVAE
jgi:branched-chain amino acid transport system permease protein